MEGISSKTQGLRLIEEVEYAKKANAELEITIQGMLGDLGQTGK